MVQINEDKNLIKSKKNTQGDIFTNSAQELKEIKKQHYQYINFIDFNVSLHCFGTAPYQNKK
ncbi:hypothetical protein CSI00_20560 [Klebsiella pneumoniae]|nr:hypothetical protein [Klebsiella pneumoniae]MBX4556620.1 hypothetical protein [Klebsiella pneumoniae]